MKKPDFASTKYFSDSTILRDQDEMDEDFLGQRALNEALLGRQEASGSRTLIGEEIISIPEQKGLSITKEFALDNKVGEEITSIPEQKGLSITKDVAWGNVVAEDNDKQNAGDVRQSASNSRASMSKEPQLRADVRCLGCRSWDAKYNAEHTLALGDVTSSEEQLHFIFFHPEAIVKLFGCGFKFRYSLVSILLDKQVILMKEMKQEAWEKVWMDSYRGPLKPFLFRRSNSAAERTAGILETNVLRLNKDEALSKFGISMEGSESQEFVSLEGSKGEGARGDMSWEPSWKSWVKAVIDHLFPNSTAPPGLLEHVRKLTSELFPIRTASNFKGGEWSEERAVDANCVTESRSDADLVSSLVGNAATGTGQEKKASVQDEADLSSREEKKVSVADKVDGCEQLEEKKLVVKVYFLGLDAPYFKFGADGERCEVNTDENHDLPGPKSQISNIRPELTVEFFRPDKKKSVSTRIDVEYSMGKIQNNVGWYGAWFQNALSLSFMSVDALAAMRTDCQHLGVKSAPQTILKTYEASASSQCTGELSGSLDVGTVKGSGSKQKQNTEKSIESGQFKYGPSSEALERFPLFVVSDYRLPNKMEYTAHYSLRHENPSRFYYTHREMKDEQQGSGLQTNISSQAEAMWILFGEGKHDYEFEASKELSKTKEAPFQKDTAFVMKSWQKLKKLALPSSLLQTKTVVQGFSRKFVLNHNFSEFFDNYERDASDEPHVWSLGDLRAINPVPEALDEAASGAEQGPAHDAATQVNEDDYVVLARSASV